MSKKLIALGLALLMIFALVGCGKNERKIIKLTLSTEDSEAILAAAGITLPAVEEVTAAGSTVKFYGWHDPFHNYAEDEIINTGYFTFTEKYGCEVEWVECEWSARFDSLANLVLAGTSPDFYPGYAESFPTYYLKGVFQSVDDYVDYTDPLWAGTKDFADKFFTLGENHYMIVTDATFNCVCAYNRRVMEEWGFDDPAELFYNNEWTWDVFYEMCMDFSDPDEDRYALDGWACSPSFFTSSGTTIVALDAEQAKFVSNLDDPRLERAANLLYDLSKNQCSYPIWNNGYSTRNGGAEGAGIKEGLCLFWLRGTWTFTGPVDDISAVWGDVEAGELMFAPIPRDPNGDGNYYIDTIPSGYSLVSGASNPEGVALLAACERFKVIDPTVISIDRKQLIEVYKWNQEMLDMWDTCYELANTDNTVIDYEHGIGSKLADAVSNCVNFTLNQEPSTWAQLKEKYAEQIDYYVNELNTDIAEFVAQE